MSSCHCRQRCWRWVVMVAAGLSIMIADGCLSTTGVYLPAWKEYFDCSMGEVSAIASVNVLFYHIGGLSGTVVDIIGYRPVVMFSGLMASLAVFISSFVSSRILLVFTYGIMTGLFSGSNYPGATVAVASYFTNNFTTVWGITSIGTALGIVVLPPFTLYLLDRFGWRGAMLLLSGILAHVVACGTLLRPVQGTGCPLRRKPIHQEADSEVEVFITVSKSDQAEIRDSSVNINDYRKVCIIDDKGPPKQFCTTDEQLTNSEKYQGDFAVEHADDMKGCQKIVEPAKRSNDDYSFSDQSDVVKVLNHKLKSKTSCTRVCYTLGLPIMGHIYRANILVISQFTIGICFNLVLSHLPASILYRGVDSQSVSFLISFIGIGSIIGRATNGFLVDFGWISAKNLYMVTMATGGLCVLLYRVVLEFWAYALLSFILGVSCGMFFSLEFALARMYAGTKHMGRVICLMFLSHGIGGFIGPILGGLAYDVTGSYDLSFYISGGILIVSSLIFLLEPKLGDLEARRAAAYLENIPDY